MFEKKGGIRRLLIRSTSVHDEGEYTCALGDQECSAEVTVIGKKTMITYLHQILYCIGVINYKFLTLSSIFCFLFHAELPPEIITKLKDLTIPKGDKATFEIELTKGDALVRWFKDDKELQFSEHIQLAIDGKRQKLKIYNSEMTDAGVFSCKVGDQVSSARLTVKGIGMVCADIKICHGFFLESKPLFLPLDFQNQKSHLLYACQM